MPFDHGNSTLLKRLHPVARQSLANVECGKIDRREFLRVATLVGTSYALAASAIGLSATEGSAATPFPPADEEAVHGGVLRIAMQVQKMDDPATFDWTEMANQTRHILEYLTLTGNDNVTRPMLAERWEASDDLKTWSFYLRKGVKWHNGDELTSDHVIFNIRRWLDPTLGSSNIGLSGISALTEPDGDSRAERPGAIERMGRYAFRLHLSKPVLSVPQEFSAYPTALVHPSFKAPLSENPIGTGAFTLAELQVGSRCSLKRFTTLPDGSAFRYWGGDVFLDEIQYIHFSDDNQLAAFASGDVDATFSLQLEQLSLAKTLDGTILSANSAMAGLARMQISQPPFDNPKLRKALQLAIDTGAFPDLVFQGHGDEGEHHHVAPIHPTYFPLPKITRDVEAAKALLKEAGYPDGINLTIDVGNTEGTFEQTTCELIRDQLRDIGVNLSVNVMPPARYWEIWDKTPFGFTVWAHRPLATQALSLAYRTGVPWNETHFASAAFDNALDEAEAEPDIERRRKKMEAVERILQEAAIIIQPHWRPQFAIVARNVHNYPLNALRTHNFQRVWKS